MLTISMFYCIPKILGDQNYFETMLKLRSKKTNITSKPLFPANCIKMLGSVCRTEVEGTSGTRSTCTVSPSPLFVCSVYPLSTSSPYNNKHCLQTLGPSLRFNTGPAYQSDNLSVFPVIVFLR